MSSFFTDYREAYNYAVREARKYDREMQLAAGKEYNRRGFYVRMALQPQNRYGSDALGEFIKPTDPLTEINAN